MRSLFSIYFKNISWTKNMYIQTLHLLLLVRLCRVPPIQLSCVLLQRPNLLIDMQLQNQATIQYKKYILRWNLFFDVTERKRLWLNFHLALFDRITFLFSWLQWVYFNSIKIFIYYWICCNQSECFSELSLALKRYVPALFCELCASLVESNVLNLGQVGFSQ